MAWEGLKAHDVRPVFNGRPEHVSMDDLILQVVYDSGSGCFEVEQVEEVVDPSPSEDPNVTPTRSWVDVELENVDLESLLGIEDDPVDWLAQRGLKVDQLFAVRCYNYSPWRGFFEDSDDSEWEIEVIGPVEDVNAR